jgi:GT2 family glycosyltransferase
MTGLVSIIIPAKNAERMLPTCLAALDKQIYRHFEVILVDNGSVDATVAIADQRGVRVLHAGGRTPTARNTGARAARGEWLLHIDSDMELAPESLAQAVAAAAAGADAIILPERNVARGYWMNTFSFGKELMRGAPGCEYGRFVSRALFERIGGYDEMLLSGEDRDMFLRILAAGARPGRIAAMTLHHIEHLSIGDLTRKTANYTRTRGAFTTKHPQAAAGDRIALIQLVCARWRMLAASPLRAAGWLTLTAFFVARDALLLWPLRRAGVAQRRMTTTSSGRSGS